MTTAPPRDLTVVIPAITGAVYVGDTVRSALADPAVTSMHSAAAAGARYEAILRALERR